MLKTNGDSINLGPLPWPVPRQPNQEPLLKIKQVWMVIPRMGSRV